MRKDVERILRQKEIFSREKGEKRCIFSEKIAKIGKKFFDGY